MNKIPLRARLIQRVAELESARWAAITERYYGRLTVEDVAEKVRAL